MAKDYPEPCGSYLELFSIIQMWLGGTLQRVPTSEEGSSSTSMKTAIQVRGIPNIRDRVVPALMLLAKHSCVLRLQAVALLLVVDMCMTGVAYEGGKGGDVW